MSSLWTPGGEVPIQPRRPAEPTGPGETSPSGTHEPVGPDPQTAEQAGADRAGSSPDDEHYEQMRRQLLELPAADIVAQHAMGLYELAALHLSSPEPRLPEARLAIDALTALVEGLSGRLGSAEAALASALPQLKMAFVEATDRARPGEGS